MHGVTKISYVWWYYCYYYNCWLIPVNLSGNLIGISLWEKLAIYYDKKELNESGFSIILIYSLVDPLKLLQN